MKFHCRKLAEADFTQKSILNACNKFQRVFKICKLFFLERIDSVILHKDSWTQKTKVILSLLSNGIFYVRNRHLLCKKSSRRFSESLQV